MGFRTLMDVIPLNASLVKGSHGCLPESDDHGAIFICSKAEALSAEQRTGGLPAVEVKKTLLRILQPG